MSEISRPPVTAGTPRTPGPLPGALADAYLVTDALGHGASSSVFAAVQLALKRPVVIKLLESQQFEMTERFRREARVLASVIDPGILPLLDFGVEDGVPYIVTPFVEARTLASLLSTRGRFAWPEAARLVAGMARALAAAHAQGVVHRDLKPANVLVTDAGAPLVIDFGLSHSQGSTHLTRAGDFVGTPRYAAPEQFLGEEVGPRTDLYSLGHILYELLAGKHVIADARDMEELLDMQLRRRVERVPRVDPPVPARLEALVVRLLEKQAAQRPPDAEFVRAELETALVEAGEVPGTSGTEVKLLAPETFVSGGASQGRRSASGRERGSGRSQGKMARSSSPGEGTPLHKAGRSDEPGEPGARVRAIALAGAFTLGVMLAISMLSRAPAGVMEPPRVVAGHRRIAVSWVPRRAGDPGRISYQGTESGARGGAVAGAVAADGRATAVVDGLDAGATYRLTLDDAGAQRAAWSVTTLPEPAPSALTFELGPTGQVRAVSFRTSALCTAQVLAPDALGTPETPGVAVPDLAARSGTPAREHRLAVPPERAAVGFRIAVLAGDEWFLHGPYDGDIGVVLRAGRAQLDAGDRFPGEVDAIFDAVAALPRPKRLAELESRLQRHPAIQLLERLRPYFAGLATAGSTVTPWRRELLPALRMSRELVRIAAFAFLHELEREPFAELRASIPDPALPAETPVTKRHTMFGGRLFKFGLLTPGEDRWQGFVEPGEPHDGLAVRVRVQSQTSCAYARLIVQGFDAARPADQRLVDVIYLVSFGDGSRELRMFKLDPLLAACGKLGVDLRLKQLPGDAPFARHWVGPLDLVVTNPVSTK